MLLEVPYNRQRAVAYAKKWALSRNPLFIDFTGIGGNCTNFVSQCVFAGCGVMNYTPTFGWYYISADNRAPAWSGVDEFFDFLTGSPDFIAANGGSGPYGRLIDDEPIYSVGDVVQLQNSAGEFYHTLLITGFQGGDILVSAQSDDALDRPLSTYNYASFRIIHIEGARLEFNSERIYTNLLGAISLPVR